MLQMEAIGHLGKDAEKKTFKQGDYLSFSVAHTRTWVDEKGEKQQSTTWVECLKKETGGKLIEYLKKGTQVWIQGEPRVSAYTKENKAMGSLCMNVFQLELLGGSQKEKEENKPQSNNEPKHIVPKNGDDDLPF